MQQTARKIVSFALAIVMLSSMILPVNATGTFDTPPNGFSGEGMDSVNLGVDSGYAWHAITDDDRTAFELENASGDIYVAGNSGKTDRTVSSLAIKVTKPGVLTFEYALSAYQSKSTVRDFLGYSVDTAIGVENTEADCTVIAKGEQRPQEGDVWQTATIALDESAFENEDALIVYIAYLHNWFYEYDTHLNYAAIRNVNYDSGFRTDVIKWEEGDPSMGTVTAQLVTYAPDANTPGEMVPTYSSADVNTLEKGNDYRLTAVAKPGYQFYGWIKHYISDKNGKSYKAFMAQEAGGITITLDSTTYYTPVFAAEGAYYLRNESKFYTTETPIDQILPSAVGVVELLRDYTIPETVTKLTVPAGVLFYVPYRNEWRASDEAREFHENIGGTNSISGMEKAYATLTIPETTTVTFNGNLVLGAQRNAATQDGFQGHISGTFGHIRNNGSIILNSGTSLTCYGLITGNGTLLAKDGSEVKESLIISDYSGGNNSLKLYTQNQMPFIRYAAQNVQCHLKMEAKATMSSMAVLFALGSHFEVDVKLFGSGSDVVFNTYVTAANTVTLERTYDGTKQITTGSGNNTAGVGLTNWRISGGLSLQTLTISLEGVINLDTSKALFPLPYNMNLELSGGTYNIDKGISVLPGSKVTVHSDATLDLTGKLYILDGLVSGDLSGDKYPTRADLVGAGFAGYGEFILNGKMNVHAGATLGGVIQSTTAGAALNIEEGAYLDNRTADLNKLDPLVTNLKDQPVVKTDSWAVIRENSGIVSSVNNWVLQMGGYGHYDDNTAWMNVPARIWDGTTLTRLTPGLYVSSVSQSTGVTDSYQAVYVPEIAYGSEKGGLKYNTADGNRYMVSGDETFSRTVSGTWSIPSDELDIVWNNGAGHTNTSSLTYGVTLETVYVENEDGTYTLTITPKKDDGNVSTKFVYLVTCLLSDGTTQTIGVKSDGVAILPAETISATIEWCVKGDLNGNGKLDALDVANLKKATVGTYAVTELTKLAGDLNGNGKLDALDVANLKKATVGTYTIT